MKVRGGEEKRRRMGAASKVERMEFALADSAAAASQ